MSILPFAFNVSVRAGLNERESRNRGMGSPLTASERGEASYLDICVHKVPSKIGSWSKRQRRLFQRAMSGIEIAWSLGEDIRFLTLTSSPDSPMGIKRSWNAFVKRVRREFGRFEYVAVKEVSVKGLEHLHILFRGCYIPIEWIRANWCDIHKAFEVFIERVYGRKGQVACYLVKYLGKNWLSSYRFWCSHEWVFRGFTAFWARVVHKFQDRAVEKWQGFLRGKFPLFDRFIGHGRLVIIAYARLEV